MVAQVAEPVDDVYSYLPALSTYELSRQNRLSSISRRIGVGPQEWNSYNRREFHKLTLPKQVRAQLRFQPRRLRSHLGEIESEPGSRATS